MTERIPQDGLQIEDVERIMSNHGDPQRINLGELSTGFRERSRRTLLVCPYPYFADGDNNSRRFEV